MNSASKSNNNHHTKNNGSNRKGRHRHTKSETLPDYSFTVGNYTIEPVKLGAGSWAQVRLGQDTQTSKKFAVKIIEKTTLREKHKLLMERERDVLLAVDNKNIIKLHHALEDEQHMYFFMDYKAGGDMFSYLNKVGRLPEAKARNFFKQLLDGVEYLHNKGIAHRDLKLENILLDENQTNLSIIDFGLCDYLSEEPFTVYCGSPCYAAPELIKRIPYKGEKSDIWSLGVLLYTFLCGTFPWYSENIQELFDKIRSKPLEFPSTVSVSRPVKELLYRMLEKDSDQRANMLEIKSSRWFKEQQAQPIIIQPQAPTQQLAASPTVNDVPAMPIPFNTTTCSSNSPRPRNNSLLQRSKSWREISMQHRSSF